MQNAWSCLAEIENFRWPPSLFRCVLEAVRSDFVSWTHGLFYSATSTEFLVAVRSMEARPIGMDV